MSLTYKVALLTQKLLLILIGKGILFDPFLVQIGVKVGRYHALQPPKVAWGLIDVGLPPDTLGLQDWPDDIIERLQERFAFLFVSGVGCGVVDGDCRRQLCRLSTGPEVVWPKLDEVNMSVECGQSECRVNI